MDDNIDIVKGIVSLDGKAFVMSENAGYLYGFRRGRGPVAIKTVRDQRCRDLMQATFGILRNSTAMPWIEAAKEHHWAPIDRWW